MILTLISFFFPVIRRPVIFSSARWRLSFESCCVTSPRHRDSRLAGRAERKCVSRVSCCCKTKQGELRLVSVQKHFGLCQWFPWNNDGARLFSKTLSPRVKLPPRIASPCLAVLARLRSSRVCICVLLRNTDRADCCSACLCVLHLRRSYFLFPTPITHTYS